ncbi:BAR domain-containing protein [Mucilaginibacter psychrotolerans]|uniref:Uncharacterized protein n=1 Tax=Mucilaginibacter psychrotolerans TaxID=1524096 RepID=A0A4Y8SGW8_9SPHI|nr:hypothetical protein [Mucilaginibacter psychrotolerans]TFF37666.1 hypothetical protein E2R66_10885 [Mucilaginibacter psychrotolerans]
MNEQDTIDLMVMVSPVLWLSDFMGKIGIIEHSDFKEDEIWVRFEDEDVEPFCSHTLFVLRTPDELNETAENKRAALWPPVPENLRYLAGLQESGSAKEVRQAFEHLNDDPELHRWATIRLSEVIDHAARRKIGR